MVCETDVGQGGRRKEVKWTRPVQPALVTECAGPPGVGSRLDADQVNGKLYSTSD